MTGFYAADGGINVSVVDGSTYTGLYAADGSINVVIAPGTGNVGAYAPCGGWWVTVSPGDVPIRAPDGSLYVNDTGSGLNKGQRVTVVAGTLHPGGSGVYLYYLGF